MTGNRAVTYQGPMKVSVEEIDYPTFELKGAGDRAELADGHHRRRRCALHPRPVRDG